MRPLPRLPARSPARAMPARRGRGRRPAPGRPMRAPCGRILRAPPLAASGRVRQGRRPDADPADARRNLPPPNPAPAPWMGGPRGRGLLPCFGPRFGSGPRRSGDGRSGRRACLCGSRPGLHMCRAPCTRQSASVRPRRCKTESGGHRDAQGRRPPTWMARASPYWCRLCRPHAPRPAGGGGRRRNGSVLPSACDPDAAATAAARGTPLSVPRLFPSRLPLHADGLGAYGAQPEAAPQPRSGCGKKPIRLQAGHCKGGSGRDVAGGGGGSPPRPVWEGGRTPAQGRPRRAAPGGAGRLCAPSPAGATPPRLSMVK